MRKLKTADIFTAGRMLREIEAKEIIQKAAKDANDMKDVWQNGFDLIWSLFEKASSKGAEEAIYTFLAGPLEKTTAEIKDLDLVDFFNVMKEFVEYNKEDLVPFFKLVGNSTTSK